MDKGWGGFRGGLVNDELHATSALQEKESNRGEGQQQKEKTCPAALTLFNYMALYPPNDMAGVNSHWKGLQKMLFQRLRRRK